MTRRLLLLFACALTLGMTSCLEPEERGCDDVIVYSGTVRPICPSTSARRDAGGADAAYDAGRPDASPDATP